MHGDKQTIGFVIAGWCALSCASMALAVDAPAVDGMMEASSGGLTLGSAALVMIAVVFVALSRPRVSPSSEKLRTQGINGRLCTAFQEENSNEA